MLRMDENISIDQAYLFIGGHAHGKNLKVRSYFESTGWVPMPYFEVVVPRELEVGQPFAKYEPDITTTSIEIAGYLSLKIVDPSYSSVPFYVFFHSDFGTNEEKLETYENYRSV